MSKELLYLLTLTKKEKKYIRDIITSDLMSSCYPPLPNRECDTINLPSGKFAIEEKEHRFLVDLYKKLK